MGSSFFCFYGGASRSLRPTTTTTTRTLALYFEVAFVSEGAGVSFCLGNLPKRLILTANPLQSIASVVRGMYGPTGRGL